MPQIESPIEPRSMRLFHHDVSLDRGVSWLRVALTQQQTKSKSGNGEGPDIKT
jgi:hypothetical protein